MEIEPIPLHVARMSKIPFEGHCIPHTWFGRLRFPGGIAHLPAIVILAEICWWFTPDKVKDEESGRYLGLKKRFKGDKLQKSYESFTTLGVTKRQAIEACKFLRDKGLITLELRNIKVDSVATNNVLFIDVVPKAIWELTNDDKSQLYPEESVRHSDVVRTTLAADHTKSVRHSDVVRTTLAAEKTSLDSCNKDIKDDLGVGVGVGVGVGENTLSKIRKSEKGNEANVQNQTDPIKQKRATSIDPDWVISPHLKQSILDKICPDLSNEEFDLRRDVFVDFWLSKAGTKDGRKTDWNATFRNHIRSYLTNQRPKTKWGKTNNKGVETNAARLARENREYRERLQSTPGVNPF